MDMSQRDIKLLWGRAANRCAFPDCRIKLSQDKANSTGSFPIGEHAHIVAEEPIGPRGNSNLTATERTSYFNRILLCPTHHTIIDKNVDDYPVEKLHLIKDQHELWVEQSLSNSHDVTELANNAIYSSLIDAAVEYCNFAGWDNWTNNAISPIPEWDLKAQDDIYKFRNMIIKAVWPGTLTELERALESLSLAMHTAFKVFMVHGGLEGNRFSATSDGVPFYKLYFNSPKYNEMVALYKRWVHLCDSYIDEATRSANWLAEVVRRDVNPMFFAVEGKFTLINAACPPEYTQEEKDSLPTSLIERVNNIYANIALY